VYPDGTLKDALRQDWGFWESKDEKDDLTAEIAAKLAKGYPTFNILFEDTHTAVLYQSGEEILRADFTDALALDSLLTLFVGYESPEVRAFHKAIEQFSADVPHLAETLRNIIDEQLAGNAAFQTALSEFLELCKKSINPKVEMADMREMIIQHVLTEDIFMRVFDEAEFHRENVIAHKLAEVAGTFYHGETKHAIHARIAPYYETINARASQISDHHEKQKFLKALYENFYKAYNPKAADRLGVIYTPDEIVRFMIESADTLTFKHFGKTLGDQGVEILDPATGTGTFITELIEYLPPAQLDYKYEHEVHCNEVAILPYYIANLNIEFTYKQKTGRYVEFENICFVDTLDNMGFEHTGQQLNFFGLTDENAERITRQNSRPIMLVIGNPPYNDNQMNENENNKNRDYPEVDKRIKDTYIKNSSAQKTHLYDMYTRFLRWASDRVSKNGIIAFVSNNSFIDARAYDGFRKIIEKEFNEIHIVNLKGNARTSGERRRKEGGNIFSDQIKVGIAVYFLTRKEGQKGCRIYYTAAKDYAIAEEKKAYLRENKIKDLQFTLIHPDKNHNWIDIAENNWGDLIAIDKIFSFTSPGLKTNRDDWVYDFAKSALESKVMFFIEKFNNQVKEIRKLAKIDDDDLDYSIKWSSSLKAFLVKKMRLNLMKMFLCELCIDPSLVHSFILTKDYPID
jgi:predicted helicase